MNPTLARLIADRENAGYTGKVELHFKDGRVLSYSLVETIRIERETHESRASIVGGSHAS